MWALSRSSLQESIGPSRAAAQRASPVHQAACCQRETRSPRLPITDSARR